MCGLVGVLGQPSTTLTRLFLELLMVDTIRGMDSTGVAAIATGKQQIFKELGVPFYLFGNRRFGKRVIDTKAAVRNFCLIGHNRAATKGKVDIDNAHPFRHDHIIMAHNGTLSQVWDLKVGDAIFETDSEAICYSIAKRGIEETWPGIFGAAALSFWDTQEGSLHLVTNGQRPLNYAFFKEKKGMVWASEAWMIAGLCNRNNIELEDNKIIRCTSDVLYTFRKQGKPVRIYDSSRELATTRDYRRPAGRGVLPFGARGVNHNADSTAEAVAESIRKMGATSMGKSQSHVEQLLPLDAGKTDMGSHAQSTDDSARRAREAGYFYANDLMEEAEFIDLYKNCVFCNNSLKDEYEEVMILDRYHAACGDCGTVAIHQNIRVNS